MTGLFRVGKTEEPFPFPPFPERTVERIRVRLYFRNVKDHLARWLCAGTYYSR